MLDIRNADGQIVETGMGDVVIQKAIGKGKSGYSYLAQCGEDDVVIKFMHDEPCAYYDFGEHNKVDCEKKAFEELKYTGITIPELLYADRERDFLIKEFVPGTVADRVIAAGKLINSQFQDLFIMHRAAKNDGLNIDYFPANFVIYNRTIYYIDYEINPYSEEWNLPNWGIYYWLNKMGMRQFLKTGDASFINQSVESGIPIKAPFQEQAKELIKKYEH